MEGVIEVTGKRGIRRKHTVDDVKDKRRFGKLKEEALDRSLCRTGFGRWYGYFVKRTWE
jgi:hypothetical protein